ncbi:MAG: hypothetical protein APR54_02925 [Candidatus Cloacimonas sp. SDB]|nr:MAG: hypothetical protein APR54_02925 [Candidatus Cloacimonas sp. SDB]
MKLLTMITLVLILQMSLFAEFELPEIHTNIVIQAESYFGDNDVVQDSSYGGDFENTIYTVPVNKFAVRSATIEAEGKFKEKIEYNMEIGMATCTGGLGINVLLMEAGLFYKPNKFMKIGFMKGHIMRGFEMHNECVGVLTAEKAHFLDVFKNQCHPTGLIFEADYDFTETMGFETQIGILNGPKEESFDTEYDRNIGLIFRTPLPGLSVGGYYNLIKQDLGNINQETNMPIYEKGNRFGFGADFDFNNIFLRGEYYAGKGFTGSLIPEIIKPADDLEMNAFYIEGAYTIKTNSETIPYIQPYVMYQSWNKAADLDAFYWNDPATTIDDNILCENFVSNYLTAGITFGLDEEHTKLKIDYEFPVTVPDNESEEAGKLIVRLQTGF